VVSEPCFIARPDGLAEDDGVVTTFVNSADGRSFALLLDAQSFQVRSRHPSLG
jgi:carotenoid cleavage dioxygenase-like enzyme